MLRVFRARQIMSLKGFLLSAGLACLALPGAAFAAETDVSVSSSGADLDIAAKTNETNNVAVTVDNVAVPTVYLVSDTGAGVNTSDPLCSEPVVGTISCPVGTITRADISLSNRNDVASINVAVPATIRTAMDGGSGLDALFGTPAADTFNGSSDADQIFAGAGNDAIDGGSGNDALFGGDGADDLDGDTGNDLLDGGFGGDSMRGRSGADTVTYAPRLAGVSAQIGATGGNGEDAVPGVIDTINADVENLLGGAGDDALIGDRDANQISGGAGNDTLLGLGGGDRLGGDSGDDFISGDAGDDTLLGGFGADAMFGGPDNDRLRSRDGTRDLRLRCGPGFDKLRRDRQDPRGKSCKRRHHRRHH
jgi:Ca2+-binding RTX toxin-like protein